MTDNERIKRMTAAWLYRVEADSTVTTLHDNDERNAFVEGCERGIRSQRRVDYDAEHIRLILHIAHDYGVCSDWGEHIVKLIMADLPEELKKLEEK